MLQTYYSQTLTYASGSRQNVVLDFLPRRGPNGGRLVITKMELVVSADFTTGATAALAAGDLHTIISQIEIKDAAGYRVNLTGEQTKLFAQSDMRYRMPANDAAVAINTTNGLRTVRYPILFQRPLAYGKADTRLPTDDLLNGGSIVVTWPAAANMPWTGGGTGVINTGTTAILYVHAMEVYDLVLYTRDERNALLQESVAVVRLPVNGNLLAHAFMHQPATTAYGSGGGGSLAGVTIINCQPLGQINLPNATLTNLHTEEGGVCWTSGDDLVLAGRALPIIVAGEGEKMKDRPRVNGQLVMQLTTTETVLANQVYGLITPKDRRVVDAATTINGVAPGTYTTSVKTVKGTVKDAAAWEGAIVFMPEKVIPNAA